MHYSSTAGLLSLAALTVAHVDPSNWKAREPTVRRSVIDVAQSRAFRRQSGWNPPSDISGALKEVWDHCLKTYNNGDLYSFENYGWDQLKANDGKINYCVRWESTNTVTAEQRVKIATSLQTQYEQWFRWLYGYDNFPYSNIEVNVVGWAVKDKSLLEGDTNYINVYTDVDAEGLPQCAETCGRFFNQDGDYSSCTNGAENHYDQSLWLTDGFQGGTGGDWGQRMSPEYYFSVMDAADNNILLHEQGHTFGLDDFYDWMPTGQAGFVMDAASVGGVTDFDGWMLRNWWYELSRNRGWQSGGSATATPGSSSPTATPAIGSTSTF